jgi:hypothetical protein
METILTIIVVLLIGYYAFMITPFGVSWIYRNLEEGKPCYNVIFMFLSAPFVVLIIEYLTK